MADLEVAYQPASLGDLEVLLQFMQQLYASDGLPFKEGVARPALEQLLEDHSLGKVWLIERQREAIGYVVLALGYSLEYGGRDAFIDELFIRASDRGQGIGTQTLKFLEAVCHQLGVKALHLEVEHNNHRAQRLYQKAGFKDHNHRLMTRWILAS